jgi:hypothetical protein
LVAAWNSHLDLFDQRLDAAYAMGRLFGGPSLRIRIDASREGDNAVFDGYADLTGLHPRIQFEFRNNITLDVFVRPAFHFHGRDSTSHHFAFYFLRL